MVTTIRIFRKRRVQRAISLTLLLLLFSELLTPGIASALTTGPHQPEFTSYESAGATDMVNLLTGDFTTSIPILEVPGPEGNFSVPLAYHAGIGLEQEASWVGLGWTLNVGAITRDINEYPDDASGDVQSTTVKDLDGVKGWKSSLLGLGEIGWNSEVGHYGYVSLFDIVSYSYSDIAPNTFSVVGIGLDKEMESSFSVLSFINGVSSIMMIGSGAKGTTKVADAVAGMAEEAGETAAFGAAASLLSRNASLPNSATSGYWKWRKKTKQKFLHKEYKFWLDQTRREEMFGVLYLGQATNVTEVSNSGSYNMNLSLKVNNVDEALMRYTTSSGAYKQGSASDINHSLGTDDEYRNENKPSVLAMDQYTVNAGSVSGQISPYRLDVGSTSVPRPMASTHRRYVPVPFQNYKVPFLYEGTISNNYHHHLGGLSSVGTPNDATTYNGVDLTLGSTNMYTNSSMKYNLQDVVFKEQRVRSDVSGFLNTANKWNQFPQSNHVEWMSNSELKASTTYTNKFIDFLSVTNSERNSFRTNGGLPQIPKNVTAGAIISSSTPTIPINSATYAELNVGNAVELICNLYPTAIPYDDAVTTPVEFAGTITAKTNNSGSYSITVNLGTISSSYFGKYADIELQYLRTPVLDKGIGGYAITAPNGMTYHFSLPVYDYDQKTEIKDATSPTTKYSTITRVPAFANTWLLTAITGADFVDRNSNGLADQSDWGYWVKFNYGQHLNDYQWASPFGGDRVSDDNNLKFNTQGFKQLYYLNTIETRSHVALFQKSVRDDSKSFNGKSSLKLDEIDVLTREQYEKLIATFGVPEYSNKISSVCLALSSGASAYVTANALKRVAFNYSYDLCKGTLNSTVSPNNPNKGKLTLKSVSMLGRRNIKIIPDYKFEYGFNPDYDINKWDGWGFYNEGGTSAGSTHGTNQSASTDHHGAAWSLSRIITPLGAEVIVGYERDTYGSVAGSGAYEEVIPFSNSNLSYWYPIDFPVSRLYMAPGTLAAGDIIGLNGEAYLKCPSSPSYSTKSFSGTFTIQSVGSNYIQLDGDYMGLGSTCAPNSGTAVQIQTQYGNLRRLSRGIKGGNIRVASIINRDEFGRETKLRYLYDKADGYSSGVVSNEPSYINTWNGFGEPLPGYPMTPVMYGRVCVLSGSLQNDYDFHTRVEYQFETPHINLVENQTIAVKPRTVVFSRFDGGNLKTYTESSEIYQHKLVNRTSKIGNLKSVKVFSKTGERFSTVFNYTDAPANNQGNSWQGVYTQGSLMVEKLVKGTDSYHKANRTSVIYYPSTLKSVTTTKDGFTSIATNEKWDLISEQIVERTTKSSQGYVTRSILEPAFRVNSYSTMGPKASNPANKHMLLESAAAYMYKVDEQGQNASLIAGSLAFWSNNWVYRSLNGSVYDDLTEGEAIWRRSKTFVWKGSQQRQLSDGTQQFSTNDKFDFVSDQPNGNWQFLGAVQRYDHYGHKLTIGSYNGVQNTTKLGYKDRRIIAKASNADYTEIAFSSGEDLDPSTNYFGGEVQRSAGQVLYKSKGQINSTNTSDATLVDAHTGDAIVVVNNSLEKTFVYSLMQGLSTNRKYRAAVWTNSPNGRLYYKLNGPTMVVSNPAPATATIGEWSLVTIDIPIGASFISLEVGAMSVSGRVVFDDFRFQPADAMMECYVNEGQNFEFTTPTLYSPSFEFILNNDNTFTKLEYNEKGQVVRTYQESFTYQGVRKVEEKSNDYRRTSINP